jgi:hypothetical protein
VGSAGISIKLDSRLVFLDKIFNFFIEGAICLSVYVKAEHLSLYQQEAALSIRDL